MEPTTLIGIAAMACAALFLGRYAFNGMIEGERARHRVADARASRGESPSSGGWWFWSSSDGDGGGGGD